MFREHMDPAWSTHYKKLAELNQGDVVEGLPIGYFSQAAVTACVDSPKDPSIVSPVQISDIATHAIIATQSCDLVEDGNEPPTRPLFLAAPVYELENPSEQQRFDIEHFRSHSLIHLTGEHFKQGYWVADLRALTSFDKGLLLERKVVHGFASDLDRRRFAEQVSWQFGRPDFPQAINDHIVASLRRWIYKKRERGEKLKTLGVEEYRLTTSSLTLPCNATLWILVEDPTLIDGVKSFFDAWYLTAAKEARQAVITLTFKVDFLDHLNAREYRTAQPVSLR